MAYQVLARKWRPGRFAELVGQEFTDQAHATIAQMVDIIRIALPRSQSEQVADYCHEILEMQHRALKGYTHI